MLLDKAGQPTFQAIINDTWCEALGETLALSTAGMKSRLAEPVDRKWPNALLCPWFGRFDATPGAPTHIIAAGGDPNDAEDSAVAMAALGRRNAREFIQRQFLHG